MSLATSPRSTGLQDGAQRSSSNGSVPHVAVVIAGSGFAGLGMAIRLRQAGMEDFVVLERAGDVGGTWRDNTYPGCQCDVPSHLYSFSFAPNPGWSRTFSRQPEIQDYLRRCAAEHELGPHLRLGCEVLDAAWEEQAGRWRIDTSHGPLTARFFVSATGGLSEPSFPDLPGLERFGGKSFHSARWDHDHDLTGERVAVIGTGASAIQFVPRIRRRVARLDIFQRTPPWILPHTDRPVTPVERWAYRRFPALQRTVRGGIFAAREALVLGMLNPPAMRGLEDLARAQLRLQVRDAALRAKLEPSYRLGCKRILVSNSFYPALTKRNVELVTDGITEVRPRSIVTADGTEREVDTIIFGTGFKVTDPPAAQHVRGRGGVLLADAWHGSAQAYLGTTVSGFPNLFLLVGPNTGTGSTSQVFMIEAQIAYVMGALRTLQERGMSTLEVREDVQRAFNRAVQERMEGTVWTSGCGSWYLDAHGRNTTLWPDFSYRFHQRMRRFDPVAYRLGAGVREEALTP